MNIIVIDKNGIIKNACVEDMDNLYKCCNYRNNNDFKLIYKWNYRIYIYELYGKTKGKKVNKNLINFPCCINEDLYGTLCIVKKDLHNNIIHFNNNDWDIWYANICNENKPIVKTNIETISGEKLYYEVYDSE